MSLATRCTECGTVFRVVQDQLKVSEGWVRCGRCSAVFNALENLCDIDAAAGGPAAGVADEPQRRDPRFDPASDDLREPLQGRRHEPEFDTAAEPEPIFVDPGQPEAVEFDTVSAGNGPGGASTVPFDDGPAAIVNFGAESPADPVVPDAPTPAADAAEPAPQFVRTAEREAFWRRPPLRVALLLGTGLLGLLLAAQLALANRDLLAAHLPASRPALTTLCQLTGCRIEPLRRIERLSVDSSGLARVEGAALYRLSVVLHNRAETPLLAPALDLSLTDAAGKLVARRVLQAADLGLPPTLEAGQELPLQALLSTGDKRVTGYTVELFYP